MTSLLLLAAYDVTVVYLVRLLHEVLQLHVGEGGPHQTGHLKGSTDYKICIDGIKGLVKKSKRHVLRGPKGTVSANIGYLFELYQINEAVLVPVKHPKCLP